MVKIYHTKLPIFIRNGKSETVTVKMFRDFAGFDKFLTEMNPTEVYVFNSTNMNGDKLITTIPPEEKAILFIRYKMFKDETITFEYPEELMEKPLSQFLK